MKEGIQSNSAMIKGCVTV